MNEKKIISFDIDGVLNDYPKCWVKYINVKMRTNFSSKTQAKKKMGNTKYNSLKHQYRLSSYKYSLPVEKKLIVLMKELKKKFKIIILTSRPFNQYPKMKLNTYNWLVKKKISFNELYYKDELIFKIYPKIFFHVDNELKECKIFVKKRINCYLLRKTLSKKTKFITNIKSVYSLKKYL